MKWVWVLALFSLASIGCRSSTAVTQPPPNYGNRVRCEPGRCLADIANAVERSHEVNVCLDSAVKLHPALDGHVVIDFVIDETGVVNGATLRAEESIAGTDVGTCLVAAVQRIRFPASSKHAVIRANHDFVFGPSSATAVTIRTKFALARM
jgi:hypothetical protein